MRKLSVAAVLALSLSSCSSTASRDVIGPGTSDGATTLPNTSPDTVPTTDATLPGVWVQPPAAPPTLYYIDNRGTMAAPLVIVSTMTAAGVATELWRETTETYLSVLDVSPDQQRLLLRRTTVDAVTNEGTFVFSVRDLGSGAETTMTLGPTAVAGKFASDGSGDVLASYVAGTSSNSLDRLGADGHLVAHLATNEDVFGLTWLELGDGRIAVGGQPITIIDAGGTQLAAAGNSERKCRPVRLMSTTTILAACGTTEEFITQLWSLPLDGGAAQQVSKVNIDPNGVDFGTSDLWATTDGRQWLQRFGDCGAIWVEELLADGSSTRTDVHGLILGVDGTRLITASNGMCEGGSTTIAAYDSVSGATTDYLRPPKDDTGEIVGVNTFDIIVVPR